jgi:Dockerin type I domain
MKWKFFFPLLLLCLIPGICLTMVGDLNDDGNVKYTDVFIFALQWHSDEQDKVADLDGDGSVDATDLTGLAVVYTGGAFPYPQITPTPTPTSTPTPTPTTLPYPFYNLEDYRINPTNLDKNRNPRVGIQSDDEMVVVWIEEDGADTVNARIMEEDGRRSLYTMASRPMLPWMMLMPSISFTLWTIQTTLATIPIIAISVCSIKT